MKRGSSGLSLMVGIDKPLGLSSHDVVNRCRRVFDERRIGHAGTLDPQASGVLAVLVGPATRLSPYFSDQSKRYRFTISFGAATDTDDAQGEVICTGAVPEELLDEDFARAYCAKLVGRHLQMPPRYSAIKVDGRKSYDAARKGEEVELSQREIEIFDIRVNEVQGDPASDTAFWDLTATVSKGTYIRSLARDIGTDLGCPAHIAALLRECSGLLGLTECLSLEELEAAEGHVALDPLHYLGMRFCLADDAVLKAVENGSGFAPGERPFHRFTAESESARALQVPGDAHLAAGMHAQPCCDPLADGEIVAIATEEALKALYKYDGKTGMLTACCVFSVGVLRG